MFTAEVIRAETYTADPLDWYADEDDIIKRLRSLQLGDKLTVIRTK